MFKSRHLHQTVNPQVLCRNSEGLFFLIFIYTSKLKTLYLKKTTKLTKKGVRGSLYLSSVKTVKVKKSKVRKYKKIFKKSNSGKKVKVKK